MNLFTPVIPEARWHPLFKMILEGDYAPERDVFARWAQGFEDRDGKFVKEFQLSFESCLWELYLHASLKELSLPVDFSHHAPDFVIGGPRPFNLEATVAAPAAGGKPAYGWTKDDIPEDLNQFNVEAALRICNSFSYKLKRYKEHYATLPHVAGKPFVVGIGAFDRPLAHFAGLRPVVAAFYGLYHDEEATARDASEVVSYNVTSAPKNENVNIDVGLFCDDTYREVSAVVYSALATWGKVRAVADNPNAATLYTTIHPQAGTIYPKVLQRLKRDYSEHLLDGLVVLHNPFADHPLPDEVFDHPRVAQFRPDATGELIERAPDDFLQVRMLQSIVERDDQSEQSA
ncbi:glycosaminoglycan attachment site [Roseateles sp.]|uniref:glycosaminoglycan attachment site n=1 Tax=Roseateles sp. TaxID=1971397 RepID=UPI0039E7D524